MNQSVVKLLDELKEVNWLQRLPIFAGGFAVALIVGYMRSFRSLPFDQRPDAWGQFGDQRS